MRRVIRKRIRRTMDGLDLAADLNVQIEANVGRGSARVTPRDDTSESERPEPAHPHEATAHETEGEHT